MPFHSSHNSSISLLPIGKLLSLGNISLAWIHSDPRLSSQPHFQLLPHTHPVWEQSNQVWTLKSGKTEWEALTVWLWRALAPASWTSILPLSASPCAAVGTVVMSPRPMVPGHQKWSSNYASFIILNHAFLIPVLLSWCPPWNVADKSRFPVYPPFKAPAPVWSPDSLLWCKVISFFLNSQFSFF